MNKTALKVYHSTFSVELTKDNSIEKTYGFIINEGTDIEPKLIHYIHGNVTESSINRVRMIFNYQNNGHFMERNVSGMYITDRFTYNAELNYSFGEFPINVAGEKIQVWL